MKAQHHLVKLGSLCGVVTAAVLLEIDQFPQLAYAATSQFLSKVNRQDLTEAVFIGVGLIICLLGLFGLDCFRARHPRVKKSALKSETKLTKMTSAQQVGDSNEAHQFN